MDKATVSIPVQAFLWTNVLFWVNIYAQNYCFIILKPNQLSTMSLHFLFSCQQCLRIPVAPHHGHRLILSVFFILLIKEGVCLSPPFFLLLLQKFSSWLISVHSTSKMFSFTTVILSLFLITNFLKAVTLVFLWWCHSVTRTQLAQRYTSPVH